jgi:hypothetical protein
MKPCADAPIAFLVHIIWSVDNSNTKKTKEAKETIYVLKQKQKNILWQCSSLVLR